MFMKTVNDSGSILRMLLKLHKTGPLPPQESKKSSSPLALLLEIGGLTSFSPVR